jgi:tetratricopeptide (TPR) repeat protein
MNDRSAGAQRDRSVPSGPWPVRSGRMPAVATGYLTVRAETGHGLDTGSETTLRSGVGGGLEMTVLTGPSGYGKTHLAAAYLAGLARSSASDLQVWINGSSKWAVMAAHAQAARDVGVSHGGARLDASAARFLEWLDGTDIRWTVVYDDIADLPEIAGLLPATSSGHVLLTCRHAVRPTDLAKLSGIEPRICQVGEFSAREALSYLAARLQHDAHDRGQAVDLAADLGHMPLALNLAAATITGSTLDCREYRSRFASRCQDLNQMISGWVPPVAAAVSLAIDLADQRHPAGLARAALALVALTDAGRGVPVQVPLSRAGCGYLATSAHAGVDQRQAWAAVVNLAQCGLVMVDQSGATPVITVHADVKAVVRRILPGALLVSAARAAADALLEVVPQLEAEPDAAQSLRDCVAKLCESTGDLLWAPVPHPVIAGTGDSLGGGAQARHAIGYWQSLLDSSVRFLGPAHGQTLATRELLAAACLAAGQFDDAITLSQISVAERDQMQGQAHPDTLMARATLANCYRSAGMLDPAIDAGERVLADLQRILGGGHRQTLVARSQLATTYRQARQYDKAIALYQQNLADWTRLLGSEHSDVVAEQVNLGRAYQAARRPDDAISVFRKVRAIREQKLGRDDPDTLAVSAYLAAAYQSAGRTRDAVNCYRQALSGREAVLGPDHPDTLATVANLASCYHAAHRLKDAIPLYERSLADCERVHGHDDPETMTARGNLAGVYHSAGRLADALPVYEQAVADFERVFGRCHPDTITARSNLAHAYHMARRRTESLEVFGQALADCERALGPDDPLTRTIRDNFNVASRLSGPAGGSATASFGIPPVSVDGAGASSVHQFPVPLSSIAGSESTHGSLAPWPISMSTGTRRVAVANCSPVPVLRMKRGCAPPEICTRSRWPAPNRCAVALIGTVMLDHWRAVEPAPAMLLPPSRSRPSQMFQERPRVSTSHSRAKTSKCGPLPLTRRRMLTGPMTSIGSASGALVKTRTSGRASSALLRLRPALELSMLGPPTDGVGAAGS